VIREVLLARAHAGTAAAHKDAERHERRVRELISHQHKLLDLYYENGVSKEVLQAQQKRLEAEQGTVQRLADAAKFEVSELDQALNDALLLIDQRRVPYLAGSPTEKRLINLAVYAMLLVSDSGDIEIQPTPLYAELVPLARKLAREAAQAGGTRPPNGLKTKQMAGRSGRPSNPAASLDPLLEHLMEPVGRQARRRAAEAIRHAGHQRDAHRLSA
jgi:hypothetical protein